MKLEQSSTHSLLVVLVKELLVEREAALHDHKTTILGPVGQEVGDSLDTVEETPQRRLIDLAIIHSVSGQ